jgi:hypothetical protein
VRPGGVADLEDGAASMLFAAVARRATLRRWARDFFFGYTRSDNSPYLEKLFDDLSVEVRMLRGLPATAEVGFFDRHDVELGEDWDGALVDALSSAAS